MVVRRDFGSYRRADANGDSRAARVQYRLGRAAAVLARAGLRGVHGDLGRHRGVFVRRNSGVLGAVEKADAVMNNLPGTIAGLANTK